MTGRARAIACLALIGLCLGTLRGQVILSLVSFAVGVWMWSEWLRFQTVLRFELPRITFERYVNGRNDATGTLWAGRPVHIVVKASCPRRLRSVIQMRDFVSEILEIVPQNSGVNARSPSKEAEQPANEKGLRSSALPGHPGRPSRAQAGNRTGTLPQFKTVLQPTDWIKQQLTRTFDARPVVDLPNVGHFYPGNTETSFAYDAHTRAAGRITFPGFRLTLEDVHGLFRVDRFVENEQTYRIFPQYFERGELKPTIKRHNSLRRHGIHRLERSGMGSELLELREYVAGDPPKSIAWKVSARRDKLLTRQYESEVPVRVHLVIDGSFATRVGGFGLRLLDQMNYVAASVARAAIAVGDPVDCLLVDENGVKRLPWFSGDRGLIELLRALADFSLTAPPAASQLTPNMLHSAMGVCHERYPELLDRSVNKIPFSLSAARRNRMRLVGVLSEVFQLSPREQVECILGDAKLAHYLQRFLCAAGTPWMSPVLPLAVESTQSAARRMKALSDVILRAIAHAHDNEVFVVLADLIGSAYDLETMKRATKLALAKHHRVAFVCPTSTFLRPKAETIIPASESIADLLLAAELTRVRDLALQLKRDLIRMGASVSFSGEQSAIQIVLAEIDTARHGRRQLQGVRS